MSLPEFRPSTGLLQEIEQELVHPTGWYTYDSSILAYMLDFDPVLKDLNLIDFLRNRENPVVVDFLASPAAIRDLIKVAGVNLKQGIAVGLKDIRTPNERAQDMIQGLVQVSADITDKETPKEIGEILDGAKADLVIQRGRAGVSELPATRRFYNNSRRHLWEMLSDDNGLLVTQVHREAVLRANGIDMAHWTEEVKSMGVDVQYVPGVQVRKRTLRQDCFGLLRLIKTPTSPSKLPLF